MTAFALILALSVPSRVEPCSSEVREVVTDFRGTKWVAVAGQKGRYQVEKGTISFSRDNIVNMCVTVRDDYQYTFYFDYSYGVSKASRLPIIHCNRKCTFRRQGNYLVMDFEGDGVICDPPGEFRVLLKQVR